MVWKPRVTVAAVIQSKNNFLLVEENVGATESRFNQPAGHLENGESIIDAVKREVLEETGYLFSPTSISGIYRWIEPNSEDTYLRFTFCGSVEEPPQKQGLDPDIIAPHWLSITEIEKLENRMRSPLVLKCFQDYLSGRRYPLEILSDL